MSYRLLSFEKDSEILFCIENRFTLEPLEFWLYPYSFCFVFFSILCNIFSNLIQYVYYIAVS
uniref:Uncharacterized protein n=1 Tax=Octopus bimaculoides TaxID=37653 RepID=A0A0L8IGA8_OCTBM